MKTKKLHLAALLIAFTVFISCIVGIFVTTFSASAATYKPTSIFSESTSGKITAQAGQALKFSFTGDEDNTVSYKRNLAYKWYTKAENDEAPVANYFSTEFSFANLEFTTFTVTLQSAENSMSADEVTTNEIVFFNNNGSYSLAFRNNDNKDLENSELEKHEMIGLSISDTVKIFFSAGEVAGEYKVTVSYGVSNFSFVIDDVFTNIRGTYAKYSASKLIPLSFSAEVPEDKKLEVSFKSLNGQSFELDGSANIKDNAAPVLVINDDIKTFVLGIKLLDFSYEVIDVCDSTVTKDIEYYQYNPEDSEQKYEELTTSIKIFDKYTYESEGKEYVSIKFNLKDDDMEEAVSYYVAWYAEDQEGDVTTFGDIDYLSVIRDNESPAYTCVDENGEIDETNEAYQAYIADVAANAEDLRAGQGYSFYLPSLEDLISDNDTTYTGLSFTVYYRTNSNDRTLSNRSFDDLDIPVNETGVYQFKVVAKDKQGNAMQFYYEDKWVTVNADNVWRINAIPTFTFSVENKGLEVEEVEELEYAYIYRNYSVEDFDIKGLPGYEEEYELYYLEGVSFNDVSYTEMIKFANECYRDGVSEDEFLQQLEKKTGKSFDSAELRNIEDWDNNGPTDENDKGWEHHDNRYEWKSNLMTFTPQENGYYIVRVKLVDAQLWNEHVYAYQIVYAESEADTGYGDDFWLENNMVTVIFAVIAAVAAIGALILWITLPSKETVEEFKDEKKSAKKSSDGKKKDK